MPPSLYGDLDELTSAAELSKLADRLKRLASPPWQLQAPTFSWGLGGNGLARYNKVEGLSVGARTEFDFGRLRADATARFGVADLEMLVRDTHKFESRYTDRLVGPYPAMADRYRERSPIHFLDAITVPVLILQGLEDRVVPPAQAEALAAALAARGVPYVYLAFEGEGHGFRGEVAQRRTLEARLTFLGAVFAFSPADDLPPLDLHGIEHWQRDLQGVEVQLAQMFEPTGNIAGFLSGYTGAGPKTIVPSTAMVKMDFRLVPNQTPDNMADLLRRHLDARGFGDIQITRLGALTPAHTPVSHPLIGAAAAVWEQLGKTPHIQPMTGGTAPGSSSNTICSSTSGARVAGMLLSVRLCPKKVQSSRYDRPMCGPELATSSPVSRQ